MEKKTLFVLAILSLFVLNCAVFADLNDSFCDQQVCGNHLELVWKKTVADVSGNSVMQIGVHPSGKNYWIEITYWKKAESSDEPLYHVNVLMDRKGNRLWKRDGYIDIPFVIAGDLGVPVGELLYKTYDRINVPFDKSLRYHVWLDAKGYLFSIHAYRHGPAVPQDNIEVENGIVHNIELHCQNGNYTVRKLAVFEDGIDKKGWQTIFRWPYPAHNKQSDNYLPVRVGLSYLLVCKSEPNESEAKWKLIRFSPSGDRRTLSESDFVFPRESTTAFMQENNGGFVLVNFVGRQYTFTRLNTAGRQIEKKTYSLSREFRTFVESIRAFKDGWIVQSADYKDLLRLSSDGSPVWLDRRNNDVVRLSGNDKDNLFFAMKNRLYMCREKQITKN